jgi:hypothetical protein
LARLPKGNRVLVGTGRFQNYSFFLLAGAGKFHLLAIMIFGQAVFSAELSAAVSALKRKERLLPAFFAPHNSCAFSCIERTKLFIRFPDKREEPLS